MRFVKKRPLFEKNKGRSMTPEPVNPRAAPGKPDDKRPVSDKAFREEMQKIEKVREVDPDEQSRKKNRQLAAQMGDKDEAVDLGKKQALPIPTQSPFDSSFYQTSSPATAMPQGVSSSSSKKVSSPQTPPSFQTQAAAPQTNSTQNPLPSPAYSPPPTVQQTPTTSASTNPSLPSSNQFWGNVDVSTSAPTYSDQNFSEPPPPAPPSPPPPTPRGSSTRAAPKEQENEDEDGQEEEPINAALPIKKQKGSEETRVSAQPFGAKEGPLKKKEKTLTKDKEEPRSIESKKTRDLPEEQIKEPLVGHKKIASADTKGSISDQELSQLPLPESTKTKLQIDEKNALLGPENQDSKVSTALAPSTLQTKGEGKTSPIQPLSEKGKPASTTREEKSDQEKGDSEHKPAAPTTQPFILPQFDSSIQPLIQAAVTQAAPYLNPETMALFHQMVGTIYVVNSRPGVSTTEIVLNSPAFKDSKFFGSTITIEKYATAPNSLNIRLSGSNEAVNSFNQNLSSLVAAFQNGNFQFRIGRIETAYQTEKVDKPVFRRKEKGEDKDSSDFKDNKGK